ncbi:MAG: hypothetical protein WC254_03915 [Candidatus Woesearchaeota archaeon]|jgi:hypothetical protein
MDNNLNFETVSIIIPVYNKFNTIIPFFNAVKKAEIWGLKKEIIISFLTLIKFNKG